MKERKQVGTKTTTKRSEVESTYQSMFRHAAFFNFAFAVIFGLFQETLLPWLGMEPLANEAFLHLFLGLVFIFGISYYWVSLDLSQNRAVVWLGFLGKSLVVLLLLAHLFQSNISLRFASLGLLDLWYATRFICFLADQSLLKK